MIVISYGLSDVHMENKYQRGAFYIHLYEPTLPVEGKGNLRGQGFTDSSVKQYRVLKG
jgi:hypothetical protein